MQSVKSRQSPRILTKDIVTVTMPTAHLSAPATVSMAEALCIQVVLQAVRPLSVNAYFA